MQSNDKRGGASGAGVTNGAGPSNANTSDRVPALRHTIATGADTLAHLHEIRKHLGRQGIDLLSANATAVHLLRAWSASIPQGTIREAIASAAQAVPRKGQRGSSLTFGFDDWSSLLDLSAWLWLESGHKFTPSTSIAWLAWGFEFDVAAKHLEAQQIEDRHNASLPEVFKTTPSTRDVAKTIWKATLGKDMSPSVVSDISKREPSDDGHGQ
jgi:hypothetical protein